MTRESMVEVSAFGCPQNEICLVVWGVNIKLWSICSCPQQDTSCNCGTEFIDVSTVKPHLLTNLVLKPQISRPSLMWELH
jgi:hypothetical protein